MRTGTTIKLLDSTGAPITGSSPLPVKIVSTKTAYESKQHSIATGSTNYAIKATGGMFGTVTSATYVSIRTTYTITVKLNATGNQAIEIKPTDSPYVIDLLGLGITVTDIFVTNASGSTAVVDIEIS